MFVLFRLLSHCPLALLHAMGWVLGWLVFWLAPSYRRCFLDNARQAGVARAHWRRAVGESGKVVAELPRLWMGPPPAIAWDGAQAIDAALQAGRGVVFLTPHLGCFEVTAQAYAARYGVADHPMTVLFRPQRKPALRALVAAARQRPGLRTAPATLGGVRQLLQALRDGHCVGLLPDQVPPRGLGVWLPYFGRPAYTMTLAARLALQSGAAVLFAWGERLPGGRGFVVHVRPMDTALAQPLEAAVAQINSAMESLVRERPDQYLWGYARYKTPRES